MPQFCVVSTYLPTDLADLLRERARSADRSLASEVRRTLMRALEAEGK
jgi:plasmid stability protein